MTTGWSGLRTRATMALLSRIRLTPPLDDPERVLRHQRTSASVRRGAFAWMTGGFPAKVTSTDHEFTAPQGHRLRVRVHRPVEGSGQRPLIVNFHGGGWVFGGLALTDPGCAWLAERVDAVVANVEYRLTPTHQHPAQVDDCLAALRWADRHRRQLGVTLARTGVMGDSAGGHLAASVTLRARDEGGPQIDHQTLVYPVLDLTFSSPSIEENGEVAILRTADLHGFRTHLLGDTPPEVASPLLASDLSGLPPALIIAAGRDPLRDDARRYAVALRDAGGSAELREWPAMPHGYWGVPTVFPEARETTDEIVRQQRTYLRC